MSLSCRRRWWRPSPARPIAPRRRDAWVQVHFVSRPIAALAMTAVQTLSITNSPWTPARVGRMPHAQLVVELGEGQQRCLAHGWRST
jgi:hypothetical protein